MSNGIARYNNGDRIVWCPVRSIIIRVINKIGRPRSEKEIHLGQTSPVGTLFKAKNLEISQFFFRVSDCCYGHCDQFCDWWI